ncbi:TIGR01906 family membrane protein [Chloroflexota bacterium]
MKTAAKWLFIFCLPVLLLTASVSWAVNSLWLYQYGFDKYGISQATGLAQPELDKAAAGLIDYFNSGDENINLSVIKDNESITLFNEREVVHLKDVKGLFLLVYKILLGVLIYALCYVFLSLFIWRDKRRPVWGLAGGSCLTLVLMLALGLGALFNFDQLFLQFHLISFANDFWMLDPTSDYLIMLFPQGFWYDTSIFCVLATLVGAIILGGVGWWYLRRMSGES